MQSWQAHTMEVWVARSNLRTPSMVFTGADDACFKGCAYFFILAALLELG
jgi:hypothetical protein